MEARRASYVLLAICCSIFGDQVIGSDYATPNFTVSAPDSRLARQVGELAEQYRKDLAIHWLGHELPQWPQRCPITVAIQPHAGGETSFVFTPDATGRSAPSQWRMHIYGSPERILDSVLPHEVTHTIFATHFGRPLPRWADEGASTTVEHESEKQKNHRMLIEFLKTKRGIPFNHMFAMKQYPSDILPLYAQGHSLVKFLLLHKGPRHFVKYLGDGMQRESSRNISGTWDAVTEEYYGYKNLSELQLAWIKWVGEGSKSLDPQADLADPQRIAANPTPPVKTISLPPSISSITPAALSQAGRSSSNENFYVQQMRLGKEQVTTTNPIYKALEEQAFTFTIGRGKKSDPDAFGVKLQEPADESRNKTTIPANQPPPRHFEYQGDVIRGTIWR